MHLEQFRVSEPADGYWRIAFANPPVNLLNPRTLAELEEIIQRIEGAAALKAVVFESAVDGFFLGRYDVGAGQPQAKNTPSGLPPFLDLALRLERSPVLSIALVRGRARGGGAEFALACDLRFASREKALFGQPEVGAGFLPGGGAIERLARAVGRSRALEIVLSADDFDAATAEKYGWINRALPDAELDDFVEALAVRIASFDAGALHEAKRLIGRHTRPDPAEYTETLNALVPLVTGPEGRARRDLLAARAAVAGADFEKRLGHYLGPL
ncbi:enoyl-CoA hydratase/isomerase family protein [Herbiconiux sp. P17]|uniref:enoyl-CoA hydratase/isomerase family protein n=1 Tax=Herbiconiux wuyangfengii TaxID=3342794 RepID=UPI0035BA1594